MRISKLGRRLLSTLAAAVREGDTRPRRPISASPSSYVITTTDPLPSVVAEYLLSLSLSLLDCDGPLSESWRVNGDLNVPPFPLSSPPIPAPMPCPCPYPSFRMAGNTYAKFGVPTNVDPVLGVIACSEYGVGV